MNSNLNTSFFKEINAFQRETFKYGHGHKKITLEMRKYTEQITRIYQNHHIT